jgi:protein-S-isoprenylcysteine O-methyltransferase Ste14
MTSTRDLLPMLVFAIVMVCWFVFAGAFIFRQRPKAAADQKRDRGSIPGVVLQGLSYAVIWSIHRPLFTPIVSASKPVEIALSFVAIGSAVGSVVIVMSAVKTLGKEWSVTARLVEGHKLATEGPYRFVRHPIYTGMLGMLLATGLAISRWQALVLAIITFFIGTAIRIRSEERLLLEAFGAEFDAYKGRVSALVPGLY